MIKIDILSGYLTVNRLMSETIRKALQFFLFPILALQLSSSIKEGCSLCCHCFATLVNSVSHWQQRSVGECICILCATLG